MKLADLVENIKNLPCLSTYFSPRVYLASGQIDNEYYDCLALCEAEGINLMQEIFIHKESILSSLFLQNINSSPFALNRDLELITETYKNFHEFPAVIEMDDGSRFNYLFTWHSYFIDLPAGYAVKNIIKIRLLLCFGLIV